MSNPISFFASGEPKPQPRARSFALRGKGGKAILSKTGQPIIRVYESGTAEAWKGQIALAARAFVPMPPLSGPLRVDIDFTMPRPKSHYRANSELKPGAPYWHIGRGDRDNLDKAVLDCLTTIGMWGDDGQVCFGCLSKHYGEVPGAIITIVPLPNHNNQQAEPLELKLDTL